VKGGIAQIVALTCHGNAAQHGANTNDFFPKNSTCVFCEHINFVFVENSFQGNFKETEIAGTPQAWFAHLLANGAKGIRLIYQPHNKPGIPDRMSAGFVGGGGTWIIEVLGPKTQSEFWLAKWKVGNQNAHDKKIWRVTYGRVSIAPTSQFKPHDVQNAKNHLAQAIREIHAFSVEHDCGNFFTQCFADALDTLASEGANLHGYHNDLAPAGFLPKQSLTLLDACQRAWVFGGMGSWNDKLFSGADKAEYDQVSEQLFRCLTEAIVVGANDSFHSLDRRVK
jgi:hypothetical protein